MASYWGAFHGNDFVKIAWREELFRLNGNSDMAFGGHPFCQNWFLLSAISLKFIYGFSRKWVSSNSASC